MRTHHLTLLYFLQRDIVVVDFLCASTWVASSLHCCFIAWLNKTAAGTDR